MYQAILEGTPVTSVAMAAGAVAVKVAQQMVTAFRKQMAAAAAAAVIPADLEVLQVMAAAAVHHILFIPAFQGD